MIRPAARSGGSSIFVIDTVCSPACAGFTSSGFFFAAMIPLSDGRRSLLSPSSTVITAGSGNSSASAAPSSARSAGRVAKASAAAISTAA